MLRRERLELRLAWSASHIDGRAVDALPALAGDELVHVRVGEDLVRHQREVRVEEVRVLRRPTKSCGPR